MSLLGGVDSDIETAVGVQTENGKGQREALRRAVPIRAALTGADILTTNPSGNG